MKLLARFFVALGLLVASQAWAGQADHVRADHAWIRILPADLPAGGYVALHNDGDTPAALTGATSPRYAHVMLHKTSAATPGMTRMQMVDQLLVPPHGEVMLAPAGYHLMFSDAHAPVIPGRTVPVTLRFADGSTLAVDFLARPANTVGADDGYFGHTMQHAAPVSAGSH